MVRFGEWGLLMGHFGDLVATQVFDLLLGHAKSAHSTHHRSDKAHTPVEHPDEMPGVLVNPSPELADKRFCTRVKEQLCRTS